MNKDNRKHAVSKKKRTPVIVKIIFGLFFLVIVNIISEVKECKERRNAMIEMQNPIIVEFPLRGEWLAINSPGTKIPSHGTNRLGTKYAYDFIQVDWNRRGTPAYRASLLQYLLHGVPINEYYCWGEKVYSPFDGIVVAAEDGYEERPRTNLLSDSINAYHNAHSFNPNTDDIRTVAGNYIIIKYNDNIYAALCHLQVGSVQVSVGQNVKQGEFIGNVGHSGNSYAPHLHFQLMDRSDVSTAQGLPCAFEEYELFIDGTWKKEMYGIPTSKDRFRFH